jgi:hypothetical protein
MQRTVADFAAILVTAPPTFNTPPCWLTQEPTSVDMLQPGDHEPEPLLR